MYDKTKVDITLASHSSIEVNYNGKYYYKNQKISLTMNRYDTLQVRSTPCNYGIFRKRVRRNRNSSANPCKTESCLGRTTEGRHSLVKLGLSSKLNTMINVFIVAMSAS